MLFTHERVAALTPTRRLRKGRSPLPVGQIAVLLCPNRVLDGLRQGLALLGRSEERREDRKASGGCIRVA